MIWNRISKKFLSENVWHMTEVSSFSNIIGKMFHFSTINWKMFGNRMKLGKINVICIMHLASRLNANNGMFVENCSSFKQITSMNPRLLSCSTFVAS